MSNIQKGILHSALFFHASSLCEFWNDIDQNRFHIHSIVPTPPGYTLFYAEYIDNKEAEHVFTDSCDSVRHDLPSP